MCASCILAVSEDEMIKFKFEIFLAIPPLFPKKPTE